MTDEDRKQAEAAWLKFPHAYAAGRTFKENWMSGYAAACEAKRTEKDQAVGALADEAAQELANCDYELTLEQAHSAKLRGYLKALALLQPPQVMQTEFWVEVSNELEAGRD